MNYKSCTIQNLISAAQKYDLEACEEIISRYQSTALKFSLFMCGDLSAAEIVVKECFTEFFEEINTYNTYRPIESWLFEAIRQKRKSLSLTATYLSSKPDLIDVTSDLETFIQTLKMIPDEQKEALIAIKILNLQPKQAAEFLNIPIKTLLSRFNDGMLQLIDNKCRGK